MCNATSKSVTRGHKERKTKDNQAYQAHNNKLNRSIRTKATNRKIINLAMKVYNQIIKTVTQHEQMIATSSNSTPKQSHPTGKATNKTTVQSQLQKFQKSVENVQKLQQKQHTKATQRRNAQKQRTEATHRSYNRSIHRSNAQKQRTEATHRSYNRSNYTQKQRTEATHKSNAQKQRTEATQI